MSKRILFYDGVYPKVYNAHTLETEPMGGTEATVIRVSDGLTALGYDCVRLQRSQIESDPIIDHWKPNVVITLRDAGHYVANKKRWPQAKHILWLHDVVSGDYWHHLAYHLNDQEATIVTVSDFHKGNVTTALFEELLKGFIRVKRVYNPLADYCVKQPEQNYDKYKLVYFSSPHKGLDYVLKLFGYLHNIDSRYNLYVANPGYYPNREDLPEGVINLGKLTHKEIIEHVRSALLVFYPNVSFPETFGLVYAEANAVGTPVIAHPIGAAREVLSHPHEVLDCREYKEVIDRVIRWSNGDRPIVQGKKEFKLENILKEWIKLF